MTPISRPVVTLILLLLLCALVWPWLYPSAFALSLASVVALNMIGAASLHLIIRTGHISLGHAAFMGVGGYAAVLSVTLGGLSPWLGLVVGTAAAGALAAVIGPIVLRLTGKYFVLVTFLLGEIVRLVFVEWIAVTGGANGISGIPTLLPQAYGATAMYYVLLLFALACVGLCALLLRSELGRAIDAVREAPNVAEASGVPVLRLKVGVFVLGCAMVGLQGGLLGFYLHYIDPGSFSMATSLNLVVMNIIGGMYSLVGPLIGAVFLVVLPETLRGFVELQQVLFGVILIVVMASFTGGMVEIFGRLRRLSRRLGASA